MEAIRVGRELQTRQSWQARTGLALVLVTSALYGLLAFDRGWIPHDEGTIAQAAERFLTGELPHRDYGEPYTGGLTALHALAFRVMGIKLLSLRLVLLLFSVAFAGALYQISLRLAKPAIAALMAVCCFTWSVPNYFASLPSWYNLFFASFCGLALIRHIETGRAGWLLLAGVFAGLSIVFKIIGLYLVVAVLLFLTYRENDSWASARSEQNRRLTAFLVTKAAACVLLAVGLVYLVRQQLTPMGVFHFVLPVAALVGVLLTHEWKYGGGLFAKRCASLLRLAGPFVLGVSSIVALFVVRFAIEGALRDLYRGVFSDPQRRLDSAAMDLPPLWALLPAAPFAFLLAFPRAIPRRIERRLVLAISLLLAVVLALAYVPAVYKGIWFSARSLAPVAVLAGCLALVRGRIVEDDSGRRRPLVFLMLSLTALVSLVQFPYAAPIYFCYVAPLVALAIAAVVSADRDAPHALHGAVLGFYLFFAVLFLNTGYVFNLGYRYERYVADGRLDLPRGGLRLPENEAAKYEYLVATIDEHGGGGEIYAGPDSPEVYFLSGRRNPTRSFFEFLGEYSARAESLVPLLEARKTRLVVLNRHPDFSPQPDLDLVLALRARYPKWSFIGEFLVMWKD